MTEHSMCQPGRPSPHGDGQAGSPGLDLAFQRAKSAGRRFPWEPVKAPICRLDLVSEYKQAEHTFTFIQELLVALT